MRLKHFLPLLFFAAGLQAQTQIEIANPCVKLQCFVAIQSATVTSSSSTTLTVQQPASGAKQVTFLAAVAQCPGQAFTVAQSQNGTAASATAGSAVALVPIHTINGGSTPVAATSLVYTASNVGGGTAIAPSISYTSGSVGVIDLSQRTVGVAGTTNNYSVTLTNSGSGSCTGSIAIYWLEQF